MKIILAFLLTFPLCATTRYIAATAGTFTGGTACNGQTAITPTTWNATAESAGDVSYVCGSLTGGAGATVLTFGWSGSSGNPITLNFDTSAIIEAPYCSGSNGCIDIHGRSYVTVNGQSTGVLENTANGDGLTYQHISIMIYGATCTNCTVENLTIANNYIAIQNYSSPLGGAMTQMNAIYMDGQNWVVSGNTIHDCGWCLYNLYQNGDTNTQIYNNYIYDWDHAVMYATAAASAACSAPCLSLHDNQIGSNINFETSGCVYHLDGLHTFGLSTTTMNGIYIYNNWFHGSLSGACSSGFLFMEQPSSGGTPSNASNIYIWNNIFDASQADGVNPNGWVGAFSGVSGTEYIFNNFLQGPSNNDSTVGYAVQGHGAAISFENNVTLDIQFAMEIDVGGGTLAAVDYNMYGNACQNSNNCFYWNGTTFEGTFAAWKTACSCDAHSVTTASDAANKFNAGGTPQSGSPAVNAGTNLTSSATGNLATLSSDTTQGNNRAGVARPSSGAWTMGAYNSSTPTVAITSPTSGQLIQTVGMTILSATVTSPSVRSRLVWYMENIRLGTTFGTNAQLATIPANAACLASWDGPWTMQCNLAAFGDGPHAIYAKLFAENVDASTGSPEASASTTYTERVSGASTQSIASMPTSGASSPMEVQTFTNGTLGSSENSGVYVDGQILSQGCGANNTTTWTSGYQVPTFFTTCFPNGTHWLTATYNMSVALPNSTILSQVVTFSGSTVSASTSHYVTNGQPVAFSTTGTIPTTLIAGNEYVNTSGSGNPSYSISGSTMTILLPSSPSTTIVANTTQVRIWNTKVNNYIGQACDGYYTVSTVTSQTNFGITVPASCPSSISTASKGFDVIVNPFCGSYAGSNTLQFQVTACPSGSPITPSGGSGTLSVNVRPISPEWGYTDLIESGVQFFVQGQYTFSNGAVPMEMEPTIAEYHNTQGNSDTLTLNIKNTDLSLTASSCTASGVTCTAADIGPVTGAFSWNNSTQTMTYNSTGSWTNPSGYPTAWETLTISKTGVEQGAVVYFQNHGSANVVPHFSHSGKILTTFTNGSSFFPLEVEGGPSPQFPAVWAGSHLQQSYFNSAYLGISANDNISNLAATSCSYSNQYGLAESWAAQWGQNLSLDTVYLFVGDYSSFRASVFWGIMSNLGYNRQACVQTLVSHLITAGVYWRLRIDDEWSDQMGKYLNSNVPISASGLFTQAAVSGSGSSQQIVFSVQDTNLNSGTGGVGAWSQSAGTGTVLQITGATHFPNQIYLPSTTNATTITAPCIGCTNGTYTSTTDSGAAMVINPFTGQGFQNVSAWPNNAYADSVTWSGGTINLTSIVCSGSTCTVNFSGAHGLTCTSPDNIVRIWSSSSGLNIVSAISSCATNSFVVTYPGGTGGTAPSPMTYTSATDPSLYITLDDTVNAAFQSFWQTVVGGVSNSPAYCFSMLGSLFGTSNAAGTQSYQFPTYATQPCSIGYIPQLDYKNIYGFDTSASGWGTYGNLESVITMRPWMAQPTSFYFAGSGAGYQPFLPGMTFNPATDHPGQLNNRPEGPVQQYANMLISGAKAMTLYSFYNTLVSSVEPGGGICSPSGCGLVANTNIGANYGIGPYVQPQQWNALTLLNSSVTQNQSLLLQPACDHQYFGPFFGVLGVGCFTGSDGTIQIVDCQSESPYGSFPINTQASAGGSVWLEFIDGWTRSLTLVAGNPSTITQEWCPAPGMWLIKALPSGSTLIDTMNFNPTLPSGATVAYVHVGYSPYDLYDTPGTLCTSRCSVPIQHNNSPAYYYVTYSSSTAPILSYNPQPIQVPSQGLP